MLSDNPLHLLRGRDKYDREGLLQALRLAVIAELDAISLYEQLASAVDDEGVRRVFLDVAREEKTHVGEFLALLKDLDREQAEELGAGRREVEELTGRKISDPPGDPDGGGEGAGGVEGIFYRSLEKSRILYAILDKTSVGGAPAVMVERVSEKNGSLTLGERRIIELVEHRVRFTIPVTSMEAWRHTGPDPAVIEAAAAKLAMASEKTILDAVETQAGVSIESPSWEEPGAGVDAVAEAVNRVTANTGPHPLVLVLPPRLYASLLKVHERTGVMELARVKALVNQVAKHPLLPNDTAIVLAASPSIIDIAAGPGPRLEYIGIDNGLHVYEAWETLAARIKNPGGIAVIKTGAGG